MRPYLTELEEYFAGTRREFTFPLDLRGTDFQLRLLARAAGHPLRRDPHLR